MSHTAYFWRSKPVGREMSDFRALRPKHPLRALEIGFGFAEGGKPPTTSGPTTIFDDSKTQFEVAWSGIRARRPEQRPRLAALADSRECEQSRKRQNEADEKYRTADSR